MPIIKLELRRSRTTFIIFTSVVALMLMITVLLYPLLEFSLENMGDLLGQDSAQGLSLDLDMFNMGDIMNYFATECGEILGLGGGLFAAIVGCSLLSKEEKEKSADFLLTHPISRSEVVLDKMISMLILISALNIISFGFTLAGFAIIGEKVLFKTLLLIFAAYYIMQIELGCICLGISSFMHRGSALPGIGIPIVLYFLNMISSISEKTEFLKFFTPFAYCDPLYISENSALPAKYLIIGAALTLIGAAAAFLQYNRKDIL